MSKKLSMRGYGLHRKEQGLPGQSHSAVRKAIDRGSLVRSISYDDRNRIWIDAKLADKEWAERVDEAQQREPEVARGRHSDGEDGAEQGALFPELRPDKTPDTPGGKKSGYKQAQAVRIMYQAQLAKLDYEERSGKLCRVEGVQVEAFRTGRVVRDSILNIADRIAAELAAETQVHVVHSKLVQELTVAMQELAEAGKKEYANK